MFLKELLLTFFYSGKAKKASGTFGSLASLPFWLFGCFFLLKFNFSIAAIVSFFVVLSAILTVYGTLVIPSYLKHFGFKDDHGSIVLDEVIGQFLALAISFPWFFEYYFEVQFLVATHIFSAFVLFRFFDIAKPSIIGVIDREVKGGFGVILDDIVSGIAAALVIIAITVSIKGIFF